MNVKIFLFVTKSGKSHSSLKQEEVEKDNPK